MVSNTTGADARGHVRAESAAVPRRVSRGTGRASSPSGGPRRNSPADAFSFLDEQQRKRTVIKLILGLIGAFFLFQLAKPTLHRRNIKSLARARKSLLQGVGESHVLPKKYLGDETADLAECKRVLLYQFSSSGLDFASELEAYLRASVIAHKLGYTFLADDQSWQYGSLRDYFLPRQIHCRPPTDWFVPASAVPLGSYRWATQDRVWYSPAILSTADDWLRNEVLDETALAELRSSSNEGILKEGATLPPALEDVFSDFVTAGRELFARPDDQLAILIRSLRMELGLGEGGVRSRKNSPTWGGNKREGDAGSRQAVEEVEDQEAHDFEEAGGAERADRGPIIGAQVQVDAKASSVALLGASPSAVGDLSLVVRGATDAVGRLSKATIAEPSYTRVKPVIFRGLKPTLLVLTSQDTLYRDLERPKLSEGFTVLRTPPPSPESLRPWKEILGGRDSIEWVWDPKTFRTLPRALRVHLIRYFLRDLITLASHTDAFVVSGSSSTGRLALVIAGVDGVVGPRDITGHGHGGRVRSVDAPWYPTSSPEALFGPVS